MDTPGYDPVAATGQVAGGFSIEAKGQEIFDKMLEVASGRHTKSEDLGYGELEFVPWQIGAVM
jgi:altronate hydrolase